MTERSSPVSASGSPTLSGILREFENARGRVTLTEIALKLGIERSALEGMIQLLVRKGRVREVCGADGACSGCEVRFACGTGCSGGPLGTVYELVKGGL